MAPFNLHGLNVVHPPPSPAPLPDSRDPLASPFPDFSAHLDLWTNLSFETDEPLAPNKGKRKISEEADECPAPLGLPNQDGHENTPLQLHNIPLSPPFDLNALLAGFGIEPFLTPAAAPTPPQQQNDLPPHVPPVPSLSQLLAFHAANGMSTSQPPAKRARTQKNSTLPQDSEAFSLSSPDDEYHEESTQGMQSESNTTPLSAAEDKRRRNTAASARFRLKKKEREAALERRAKDLEDRVVDLERECEGLRRENGWLKGLVVGVTGAGAAQQQQTTAK
ncbi:hypothetical protein BU15DRAFT_70595 [Melanogaster broomeanus]|nr:hypothetical protein BU15DRAFT_70595 [Melanogaster broomeanus]